MSIFSLVLMSILSLGSRYSSSNMSGKLHCKLSLQKELGFEQSSKVPLIGFVGRLDHQKGPDIVLDAIGALALDDCQVVMLGSGDIQLESRMKQKEADNRYMVRTKSFLH